MAGYCPICNEVCDISQSDREESYTTKEKKFIYRNGKKTDNYVEDEKLVKKFNAILLLKILRYGDKNYFKSIIKDIDLKINIVYALKWIVKKLCKKLIRISKLSKLHRNFCV